MERAKDELAAEILIRRVLGILKNERLGIWAQGPDIEGLRSENLMEHEYCFQVERHTMTQQSITL